MTLLRITLVMVFLLASASATDISTTITTKMDGTGGGGEGGVTSSSSEFRDATHNEKWTLLLEEATRLHGEGDFTAALGPAEEALAEARTTHGEFHLSVALVMHRLASICGELRRSDAESLYVETIRIWEALPDPHPVDMAKTISNFGVYCMNNRRYDEAEKYLQQALQIKREHLPENDISIAYSLDSLGSLYGDRGEYSTAMDYYGEAIEIRRNCDPPQPRRLLASLNNLASLYSDLWRKNEAIRCVEEMIQVAEVAGYPDRHALALGDLSFLCLRVDPERSIALALRGLEVLDASDISVPEVRFGLLKNLGIAHRNTGQTEKALLCHQKCDSLVVAVIGEGLSSIRLESLRLIAEDCRRLGKYSEADSLFTMIRREYENVEGKWHPLVGETLMELVALCFDVGDEERGLEASRQMYQIWDRDLTAALPILQGREAFDKSALRSAAASSYFSFFLNVDGPDPSERHDATQIALGSKGRISDELFFRQRALKATEDPEVVELVNSLKQMRLELSEAYVSGALSGNHTSREAYFDSLEAQISAAELELTKHSRHLARQMSTASLRSDDVASHLPAHSVLVEYVIIDIFEQDPDGARWVPHYLVVVLDDKNNSNIIDLGPAADLNRLVDAYRSHMLRCANQLHPPTIEDEREYREIAAEIYRAAVDPIEDDIADRSMLIVAPDGALNLVSFAGLVGQDGRYLTETYNLHYLSAGRDLLRLQHTSQPAQGLFVIGDPDFDAEVEQRLTDGKGALMTAADPGMSLTRGARSDCDGLWRGPLQPLPYSGDELDLVVDKWRSTGETPVDVFVGTLASEDNFKLAAPGHRVIHISTHGYYDDGSCLSDREERSDQPVEGSLLLSGLYFSGANLRGAGVEEAGCEDGILTAYEVSSMNLDGTDVVVLAACETGLGEVMAREGVFGLRRAFLVAGAKTVVCALWPVSDESTAHMMGSIYSVIDKTIMERVRSAQLAEIQRLRQAGLSDHPYNWAGFVPIGDWR